MISSSFSTRRNFGVIAARNQEPRYGNAPTKAECIFAVGCVEELGSCELYRTAASIAATARGVAGWLRINLANRAQAR